MKRCPKCKKIKAKIEYHKYYGNKDGLQSRCKSCIKESDKKRYKKNKQKMYLVGRKRKIKIREEFEEYKKTLICEKCGFKGSTCPKVIEFHHRKNTNKINRISVLIAEGHARSKIFEEINKCDILCANCHRILHWKLDNES